MNAGVLIVDKKAGPTSFDVVRDVKRLYPGTKVGHAGSLDPFATGVLVVLLGKATRLSNLLLNADKSYRARLKLGVSTDSMDVTGNPTQEMPVPELTEKQVETVLKSFEGEWHQTPPMFSAKKIDGVRLYTLARQNIEVEREKIAVQLFTMKFISMDLPFIEFEVSCSKGTYIRALADEIGKKLGSVAHLTELRRLSCGQFQLSESKTVDDLKGDLDDAYRSAYEHYVRLLSQEALVHRRGLDRSGAHSEFAFGKKGC